jgi:polysaccharide export outer membrane protein
MASSPATPVRRAGRTLVALLALVTLVAGCAAKGSNPPAPTPVPYRVGPPDRLQVTILPEPVIQRSVVVRPDGMISVELIGDVPASGRTVEEIAQDIEKRIARFKRDADVTVSLEASLSTEITVLGEVGRPSTFPLSRETRIVEAIGLVGGPRLFAAKSRIRVIRPQGNATQVYSVSLNAIENGDLSQNMLLQPGDLVIVPPTVMASIGYKLSEVFFPFSTLFGFGSRVTTTVVTGGANRALGF